MVMFNGRLCNDIHAALAECHVAYLCLFSWHLIESSWPMGLLDMYVLSFSSIWHRTVVLQGWMPMWVLQITGGVLFLAFGVHALYEGMYDLSWQWAAKLTTYWIMWSMWSSSCLCCECSLTFTDFHCLVPVTCHLFRCMIHIIQVWQWVGTCMGVTHVQYEFSSYCAHSSNLHSTSSAQCVTCPDMYHACNC